MGKVLHLHVLVILLALVAGAVLAGIAGALLAVPLMAIDWTVIKIWTGHQGLRTMGSGAESVHRRAGVDADTLAGSPPDGGPTED